MNNNIIWFNILNVDTTTQKEGVEKPNINSIGQ